jgi:uncharacterized membrane protein YgcG
MKLFLFLLILSVNAWAEINMPQMVKPVIDETNQIDAKVIQELESKILKVYKNKEGPQLQVLVVSSLNGYPIEDVAEKVFNTWGLGDSKRDDGVLFLVAIKDRKMRIEVGYGLEGALTDLQSRQITSEVKKYFKREDYSTGISVGVEKILEIIAQKDAVQMPVSSVAATRIPETVKKSEPMTQKEKEILVAVFFYVIAAVVIFLLISNLWRVYSKRVQEYNESVASKDKAAKKLDHLKIIYGVTDIQEGIRDLDVKREEMEQERDKLFEAIESEKEKNKSSPQTRFDEMMEAVGREKRSLQYLESEVKRFQQIIKEGR